MSDLERSNTVSPFDAIRRVRPDGSEFWSARDLMRVEGYRRWEKFQNGLSRAIATARNQGHDVEQHFPRSVQMVEIGSGASRPVEDFHLSRFAAYLVAMNGDPNMPEVAAAQAYFAVRTREAETRPAQPLTGHELMAAGYAEAMKVLEQRDARIHQLEAKVTADAPKVTYVDTYVTDADLLSFSTVASTNGVKESWLRDLLIERDWIYIQADSRWSETAGKKVTRNRYSEKADKKRYFRRVEVHEAPRFRGSEVMHTLKVTPQGAEAIARLIARETAA